MISGILNINKPTGPTSCDVVDKIRKITGIKKVGHAGTLDPLAQGILLILIGQATKLQTKLMNQEKTYLALIRLGATSDTYDGEGKIKLKRVKKEPTAKEIEKTLKNFKGVTFQTPPIFSAIKIGGRPAYKLARRGKKIKLKPRKVKISQIKIIDYCWPFLKIMVVCSRGTYIRSLANDIGEALSCGAYLEQLVRIKIGQFEIKKAVSLDELTAKNWLKYLTVLR